MTRTLLYACCLWALWGCTDRLEPHEPEIDPVIATLTSHLWIETETSTGIDGSELTVWNVWNFGLDGNGYHAITDRLGNAAPVERQRTPFQWAFTNQSLKVIYINGDLFAHMRYWLIDNLTDTELTVSTAMRDPVINPGSDITRRHFHARNK